MAEPLALDDLNLTLARGGTNNLLDFNFVHHTSVAAPGQPSRA
jgi:hypothetical protein